MVSQRSLLPLREYADRPRPIRKVLSLGDSHKLRIGFVSLGEPGCGIFAREAIDKGEPLVRFAGHRHIILDRDDCRPFLERCALQVGPDCWAEPVDVGGRGVRFGQFLNHSCEPNGGIGARPEFIVARRTILPNEHITIDYGMAEWDDCIPDCHCGASSCRRGPVGGAKTLIRYYPEVWSQYVREGLVSPWLLHKA